MAEYDAIVVGAGPGGSAAARYLASTGARVLVLEKKQFPRAKTCGDGLTPRAIKVLDDMGLGSQLAKYQRVHGLRVLAHGRTLEIEFPKGAGYPHFGLVRPRLDLDKEVAQHAQDAGAEYRFQTEATEPVWEDGALVGVRWTRKEKAPGGGVI
ncbi:MAG: FAD-dependent monooxygenase, partial [Actinomycetota bacterium]